MPLLGSAHHIHGFVTACEEGNNISAFLQMRQSRPREVKWLVQGHTIPKRWTQHLKLGGFTPQAPWHSVSRTQRATKLEDIFPLAGSLEDGDWWKEIGDLLGQRAGTLASDPTVPTCSAPMTHMVVTGSPGSCHQRPQPCRTAPPGQAPCLGWPLRSPS